MKVGQERLLVEQRAGQIKNLACRENGVGQAVSGEGESWSCGLER